MVLTAKLSDLTPDELMEQVADAEHESQLLSDEMVRRLGEAQRSAETLAAEVMRLREETATRREGYIVLHEAHQKLGIELKGVREEMRRQLGDPKDKARIEELEATLARIGQQVQGAQQIRITGLDGQISSSVPTPSIPTFGSPPWYVIK